MFAKELTEANSYFRYSCLKLLLIDVITIWFSDKLQTLAINYTKNSRIASGAARNKTLEQKRFFAQELRSISS